MGVSPHISRAREIKTKLDTCCTSTTQARYARIRTAGSLSNVANQRHHEVTLVSLSVKSVSVK